MQIAVLLIGVAAAFVATLAVLCWRGATVARKDELFRHGDVKPAVTAGSYPLVVIVGVTLAVFALSCLVFTPLIASGISLAALAIGMLTLRVSRRRKAKSFDRQLQSALSMVAQNLRAGQTIETALANVGDYMSDPLKSELALINAEVTLAGVPLESAFQALAKRRDSKDVAFLATAIGVQRVGGGKMAELIDSVSSRIASRQALRRHIETTTAQARLVSKIIAVVPFAVLALFLFGSPDITRTFWASPIWPFVVMVIAALDAIGLLIVRRIYSMPVD